MDIGIYENKNRYKLILLVAAMGIGAVSLVYTNRLVKSLAERERKMIDLYAKALKSIASGETVGDQDFLFTEIVEANSSIPVILTDEQGKMLYSRNFTVPYYLKGARKDTFIARSIANMRATYEPIMVDMYGIKQYIYYQDSEFISQLRWFPLVQMGIIGVFGFSAYLALSASRRAEQNRVWVGLAKETAHQLGTPLSSLMAWVEFLRADPRLSDDPSVADELQKDVERLNTIAERFSSIGSVPTLVMHDIVEVTRHATDYLQARISSKIQIRANAPDEVLMVPLNTPLFEWVIENVVKNAVDAIGAQGRIDIHFFKAVDGRIVMDIADSGKGMTKLQMRRVFDPGFTTKKRGWGLGLTLAKRIVEAYHRGKIYVKASELGKGTTFRISFKA